MATKLTAGYKLWKYVQLFYNIETQHIYIEWNNQRTSKYRPIY